MIDTRNEKRTVLVWRDMPGFKMGLPVEVSTAISPFLNRL